MYYLTKLKSLIQFYLVSVLDFSTDVKTPISLALVPLISNIS